MRTARVEKSGLWDAHSANPPASSRITFSAAEIFEFTFDNGASIHLTTAIAEVYWLRKRSAG